MYIAHHIPISPLFPSFSPIVIYLQCRGRMVRHFPPLNWAPMNPTPSLPPKHPHLISRSSHNIYMYMHCTLLWQGTLISMSQLPIKFFILYHSLPLSLTPTPHCPALLSFWWCMLQQLTRKLFQGPRAITDTDRTQDGTTKQTLNHDKWFLHTLHTSL